MFTTQSSQFNHIRPHTLHTFHLTAIRSSRAHMQIIHEHSKLSIQHTALSRSSATTSISLASDRAANRFASLTSMSVLRLSSRSSVANLVARFLCPLVGVGEGEGEGGWVDESVRVGG